MTGHADSSIVYERREKRQWISKSVLLRQSSLCVRYTLYRAIRRLFNMIYLRYCRIREGQNKVMEFVLLQVASVNNVPSAVVLSVDTNTTHP